MQFTINTDKIQKTLENNYQLIIIIVAIVFLYFLFYTDYIVQNNKPIVPKESNKKESVVAIPEVKSQESKESPQLNHVKFDDTKNKEIYFENTNGRLNIDYNAPQVQELQRISQCTYPMNSKDQLNMRDCTIDQSCLTRYSPQEWFAKQRQAKNDLPGFN